MSLSSSNLPSGVTYSFSPSSGALPFSSVLTLNIGESAPEGTKIIEVKAHGAGFSGTANIILNIKGGSFSLSLAEPSVTLQQGENRQVQLAVNPVDAYNKKVTVGFQNVPSGVTIASSPTQVYPGSVVILIIMASEDAEVGTYHVTVKGTGEDGETNAQTLTITIKKKPPFDFKATVPPTSVEINQGETASLVVQIEVVSGEPEEVKLSVQGLPSEASYTLSPDKLTPPGTATLVINAGSAKGGFHRYR